MGDQIAGKPPTQDGSLFPFDPDAATVRDDAASSSKYHPLRDMWLGSVYGARAVDIMGPLGIFAWILTGFVPVLGTVVALRDAHYAWKIRDWWSLFFNALGLLPFVKGFSSIAVFARLKRYHRAMHVAHRAAHTMRGGRALGAAGSRVAKRTVLTGTAHGAAALASVRHEDTGPLLANKTAWPALILGLLLLLSLPTLVGLALFANIDGDGLLQILPLPYPVAFEGAATLVSLACLLLALHARRVSRRLKESERARPNVSRLAIMCTGLAFLVALVATALLLYGERANILPR